MSAKAILSASVSAPPAVYVEDVFSTFLYTGNGSTQTITNGIDLSGKGGLVWLKGRNDAGGSSAYGGANSSHQLFDTARGMSFSTGSYALRSNGTNSQTNWTPDGVNAISTGFNISNPGYNDINYGGNTYCSWTFRKQPKFFDVVTYTGTGSNTTIAHNLGSVPGSIIVKQTNATRDWFVYHRSTGNTQYLALNLTDAAATASPSSSVWNDTSPTSTQFTVGNSAAVNGNGGTYVAYLFAHNAGGFGTAGTDNVVSCGSYAGTGTAGLTVNLGWEPQFVIVKNITTSGYDWIINDTMRGMPVATTPDGQYNRTLTANTANAESTSGANIYPIANGFVLNSADNFGINKSSNTFIYIAIRRGPMKTPTDATKVFYPLARTGTAADTTITGAGFPPDAHLNSVRNVTNNGFNALFLDKLRGPNISLIPLSTDAETLTTNTLNSFNQDGVTYGMGSNINSNTKDYINWMFRRAPGFFDVVAYTGTGSARTVNHNLGVVPELMIVKVRGSSGYDWAVYYGITNSYVRLQDSGGRSISPTYWNNTAPTAAVFSVNDFNTNNSGQNFIAYLFATLAGVSKVFNFTGTGTTLQIDCGFTNGARLVLIKRTDSTGDWYIWDSARGIISGNDPYLLLNSTAAEVTNTDYIDPYSAGFEISSTAPAAINANGGSYIGLAIA